MHLPHRFRLDPSIEVVMPYKDRFIKARRQLVEMLEWLRDECSTGEVPQGYSVLDPDGHEVELLEIAPEILDEGLVGPCFSPKIDAFRRALTVILRDYLLNYGVHFADIALNMLSKQVGRLTFPGLGGDEYAAAKSREVWRLQEDLKSESMRGDPDLVIIEVDVLQEFWAAINIDHPTCECRSCMVNTERANHAT